MRYSKQKEEILKVVLNTSSHPDAVYIYNKVRNEIPNISLGTVYRNLNTLADAGMIRKIMLDDGNIRFDKTLSTHNHIKCMKCGKVEDISILLNSNDIKKIEKQTGFKITDGSFNINGVCENCLKERKN